jgi:hypothetical protein
MYAKFHKDGFRPSKVNGEGFTETGDRTIQVQESRLKMYLKELDSSGSAQSPEAAFC